MVQSLQYASKCRVPNKGGKRKSLERVCKSLLEPKAKPLPLKQSVKLKCEIWSKITKKCAKKCLDASSL